MTTVAIPHTPLSDCSIITLSHARNCSVVQVGVRRLVSNITGRRGDHFLELSLLGATLTFIHRQEGGVVWVDSMQTPKHMRRRGIMTTLVRALVNSPDVLLIKRASRSALGEAFAHVFTGEIHAAGKVNEDDAAAVSNP